MIWPPQPSVAKSSTLWLKKFLLISVVKDRPFSLRLCPLVLVFPTSGKVQCNQGADKSEELEDKVLEKLEGANAGKSLMP